MKFADFYSGAGGWTLGLELAGFASVASGEIWNTANKTRSWNLGEVCLKSDVRNIDPYSIPDCDVIVGSPPCTQFSYANRGGNGDLVDGMQDVRAFLEIIKVKQPLVWVMENVPRLTGILESELAPGGSLEEYAYLFESIDDFDMSEWGVPQRRRRCIAGRYPRERLLALRGRRAPTLGEILNSCAIGIDPVWGHDADYVGDNDPGVSLSWEEARINEEKKNNHPIYNDMSFPDAANRVARTITATCTKVSRESIVVPDGADGFRMLSVREAAAIQSFPLGYQFVSPSRSDRIKMAGNAIPPLFTYFVGLAIKGESIPVRLPSFVPVNGFIPPYPAEMPSNRKHRQGRSFRAALRRYRFKSAMSFEMNNSEGCWKIVFNTGGPGRSAVATVGEIAAIVGTLPATYLRLQFPDDASLQNAWESSVDHPHHPYRVLDHIESARITPVGTVQAEEAVRSLYSTMGLGVSSKALRNATSICDGLRLAAQFNQRSAAALGEAA